MATVVQRASSIADALINGTATAAQKQRIADAFSPDPLNETAAQKSQNVLVAIRQLILDRLKIYEAQAAVVAAQQNSVNTVTNDFAELP